MKLTNKEIAQFWANKRCAQAYNEALKELMELNDKEPVKGVRLNKCSAMVFKTPHWYILKSYETYVAVIERDTDTLYDCLRLVYGYTATSAQHISKFNHAYGAGKWGVTERVIGRPTGKDIDDEIEI